ILSIRIDLGLKVELENRARKEGITLESYVDRVLILHHVPRCWLLRDVQPVYRADDTPGVSIAIAEGWPLAMMGAAEAIDLADQLTRAARLVENSEPAQAEVREFQRLAKS